MKWFKHDTDAHTDAKLKRVLMRHGLEGYGLYWYCLELIAKEVSAQNLTFELEEDSELIAHNTGLSRDRVEHIMRDLVELGLFDAALGVIRCLKLAKRLDQSQTGNPEMRRLIRQAREDHDSVMTQSGLSHDSVKTDKIRLDKKRKTQGAGAPSAGVKPPSIEDVRAYCEERVNGIDPEAFCDYYAAQGWKLANGRAMKDWKAAVRTWEKRRQERERGPSGIEWAEMGV